MNALKCHIALVLQLLLCETIACIVMPAIIIFLQTYSRSFIRDKNGFKDIKRKSSGSSAGYLQEGE